jgi:hypothetical protein
VTEIMASFPVATERVVIMQPPELRDFYTAIYLKEILIP